ncbi:hypothetical protein PFISCL1PPCAC_20579, partial [Pristionchus fissidentatus]
MWTDAMDERGEFEEGSSTKDQRSLVVEFKVESVVNFIVLERDVILVDRVPLLEHNLLVSCSSLGGDELLEVANRIRRIALDTNLLAQSVVDGDLDHRHRE